METTRIAELLEPFLGPANNQRLPTRDLQSISTYIDLLLRWNARVNLTAVRDPDEIVTRHFGESLFAARYLFPDRKSVGPSADRSSAAQHSHMRVADLGSGAGFPGLPIKLWEPQIALTLIESSHKKAAFLREVVRALTLTSVDIQAARAETVPEASFDVVTLRAVERFDSILPTAARLVAPGGRLALLIGSSQLPKAEVILRASPLQRPSVMEAIPVPLSLSRVLVVVPDKSRCQEGTHQI
jgi:16S rRNA (guanine527-N7)-methyltransferase